MGDDVRGKMEGPERNSEVEDTHSWETLLSGMEGGSARKLVHRDDKGSCLGCSLGRCNCPCLGFQQCAVFFCQSL